MHNRQASPSAQSAAGRGGMLSPPYPQHETFPDVSHWLPHQRGLQVPDNCNEPNGDSLLASAGSNESCFFPSLDSISPGVDSSSESDEIWFTLIRRDPATAEQWNVASICSHPRTRRLDPSGAKIEDVASWFEVVLETAGYFFAADSVDGVVDVPVVGVAWAWRALGLLLE